MNPPCAVPVCTLILLRPTSDAPRSFRSAGADARERVEGIRRQRGRAMLHRTAQVVVLASGVRELFERLQVDLHVRPDSAVGVDEPPVRGPCLYADLAEADQRRAALL